MLYTASFYEPRHWVGVRYRISRAHPRGRKTEWQVQPALYPSRSLLTDYRQGNLTFPELDARYRQELEATFERDAEFRSFLEQLPNIGRLHPALLRTRGRTLSPPLRRRVAVGARSKAGSGTAAVKLAYHSLPTGRSISSAAASRGDSPSYRTR